MEEEPPSESPAEKNALYFSYILVVLFARLLRFILRFLIVTFLMVRAFSRWFFRKRVEKGPR
jgi:hypothetical protein